MAIYHLNATIVQRSKGHSATAAAAYQSGDEIMDERTGEVHDYSRRGGVVHSELFSPTNAPKWAHDRTRLWNEVEKAESRRDAQLCRKFDIALPAELTPEQRLELVREYSSEFTSRGMIIDTSIHEPHLRKYSNNHHFHIVATMREIESGKFGKKNRDWNRPELIKALRERWAFHVNNALKNAGHESRIDHRSLEAQREDAIFFAENANLITSDPNYKTEQITKAAELSRPATIHLGKAASALERRGIRTERGDYNRHTKAQIIDLASVIVERNQYKTQLTEINMEIETVKTQIINLQEHKTIVEKATVGQFKSPELNRQTIGQSEALLPQHLETKALPQQPASYVTVSDKIAEKIVELEKQYSKLDAPDASNQKEQIEQQRKIMRAEISELEKVRNDFNRYYPTFSVTMTSTDDIRERIKRPDIMHLILLIEQVNAKKLTRKRHEEMTTHRR